jgi:hypothetical protein
VSFAWIRQNQFIIHLLVSLHTSNTIDSCHVNTCIINGKYNYGTTDNEETLKHQDVKFVFEMITNIKIIFGKPMKGKHRNKNEKITYDYPFKKQSILFIYIPYWKEFEIGHGIDTHMLRRVSLKLPSV